MIDLDEFKRLKVALDQKQREAERAAGQLDQLTKQLKEEFGCDTIEKAEKLLAKMQRELETEYTEFEKELAEADDFIAENNGSPIPSD